MVKEILVRKLVRVLNYNEYYGKYFVTDGNINMDNIQYVLTNENNYEEPCVFIKFTNDQTLICVGEPKDFI